jgi:hypothetical protein
MPAIPPTSSPRRLFRLGRAVTALLVAGGGLVGGAGPAHAAEERPLVLVERLVVAAESGADYDRDAFDYGIDADGDGCDTRREVLIAESTTPPKVSASCSVSGTWFSYYDEVTHTDPAAVEIDHTVALAEAWDSGARTWDQGRLRAFANDTDLPAALNVLTTAVNRAKLDKDIAQWQPPAPGARCTYARDWLQTKYKWDLSVDPAEKTALVEVLRGCGDSPLEVPAKPGGGTPPPAPVPAGADTLTGGASLAGGQWVLSGDRTHGLAFQADGNLVAYGPGYRPLWSSATYANPGATFAFQADGNAVVYSASGRVLWSSGTYGNPGARLRVQDDGNVVVTRADGSVAFYTGGDRTGLNPGEVLYPGQQVTSPTARYHLILQADGNLVTYERSGRPVYFAGSYGATTLRVQSDGNLVAYRADGRPTFDTGTFRAGRVRLEVQDDGNVVLYDTRRRPVWYSGQDTGAGATTPSGGVRP